MKLRKHAWWMCVLIAAAVHPAYAATVNGNSLALKSTGQNSGSAFILDRNGFAGTYITLAQPGNVKIDVAAEGSGGASMGVAVADAKASFAVATGPGTYSHTFALPVGTHFVRTELNNDRSLAGRQLKINSLSITGATIANANSNANALAASDTYVANYRKGPATVQLPSSAAGQQVHVSLKRLAFDWGAGVDLNSLGTEGTTRQHVYQQYLNQNFNEIVCQCHWASTEPTQGNVKIGELGVIRDYAAAHNMHTRLHNLIWNGNQPEWVDTLRTAAVTEGTAKAQLLDAIENRIDYYIGGTGFDEVDVYNESYNDGVVDGAPKQYWQLYGAAGVAKIYHDAGQASPASKMFVNDFAVLQGSSNGFNQHIDTIQQAGVDAGYGDAVEGIGLQFYTSNLSPDLGSEVIYGLQNMNVQGLPTVLTEFGTFAAASDSDTVSVMGQLMRLVFGNPSSTGFVLWDWTKENGGVNQFAPNAALYNIEASDWSAATLTNAGKVWQDQLGIQDWDGNPNNGWNTQLTLTAGANGKINFNGFYGDYEITVGNQTYDLTLTKGVTNYVLGAMSNLQGDFNGDGRVDAGDYTVWRNGGGDPGDYQLWKTNFGRSVAGGGAALVPEPGSLASGLLAIFCGWIGRRHPL